MRSSRFVCIAILSLVPSFANAQVTERKEDVSLAFAVNEFNSPRERQSAKEVGQSELTEAELIGAIRRFPHYLQAAGGKMDDKLVQSVLQIAENEVLPANAKIMSARGTHTGNHYLNVYDIHIWFKTADKTVVIPVRQVVFSSRKIRPEERRDARQSLTGVVPNYAE